MANDGYGDGDVCAGIDALIDYAVRRLDLDARNVIMARNCLLDLCHCGSYAPTGGAADGRGPDELLQGLCASCVAAGLLDARDAVSWSDAVMGALSMNPARLQDCFAQMERTAPEGGMAAMQWLYDYCVANTYVKKAALDRNPRFDSHGLTVTINLAKPEFANMRKAASGNSTAGGYPKCTICRENEGFAGRDKRTLRTVPVRLGGHEWFWQFSPYGYFNQHGICVNVEHTPMHVDRDTFVNLLDFVDRFPGYFIGCNAALPRIGGSVLAHDHYQGGGELMPMHKAAAWAVMRADGHPGVTVEVLDWPSTAMRVVSRSRRQIVEVSDLIRQAWERYSNPSLDIVPVDAGGGRQSSLSPSVVSTRRGYEMNLILRNNGVSERYPDGIFHAHPEFYPVKQEPIGLIEAQGLFILPGRLVRQLGDIEEALASGGDLPDAERDFTLGWEELTRALDGCRDREVIHAAVRDELGSVCERILGNTAVFKDKSLTCDFLRDLGFADV